MGTNIFAVTEKREIHNSPLVSFGRWFTAALTLCLAAKRSKKPLMWKEYTVKGINYDEAGSGRIALRLSASINSEKTMTLPFFEPATCENLSQFRAVSARHLSMEVSPDEVKELKKQLMKAHDLDRLDEYDAREKAVKLLQTL